MVEIATIFPITTYLSGVLVGQVQGISGEGASTTSCALDQESVLGS